MSDELSISPPASVSPMLAASVPMPASEPPDLLYMPRRGAFELHGKKGRASFIWKDGGFFEHELIFVEGIALSVSGSPMLGWVYQGKNTNFFIFFGDEVIETTPDFSLKIYGMFFSLDKENYFPWPTSYGALRNAIQPLPAAPAQTPPPAQTPFPPGGGLDGHIDLTPRLLNLARGKIHDFHRQTGYSFGPLGPATGDPTLHPDRSISQLFELGEVILPPAGDIPAGFSKFTAEISLQAVKCFGTEDPGGPFEEAADETFLIISLISINPNFGGADVLVKTIATEIQNNVHRGDVIFKGRTLGTVDAFPGSGIRIHVAVFDHEYGNVDALRDKIQGVLDEAAKRGAQTLAAAVAADDPQIEGPVGDVTEFEFGGIKPFKILTGGLAGVLADLLGDDLIGEHTFVVPAANIVELTDQNKFTASFRRNPEQLGPDVQFNWPRTEAEEYLFAGGGGSYKVYFKITPNEIKRPLEPRLP